MPTREQTLFAQLAQGMLLYGEHETKHMLGDRGRYVGMSDVGKGVECMRAAVASKLGAESRTTTVADMYSQERHEQIYMMLCKQLVLQRGHWLEAGVLPALESNGANIFPQLEITTSHNEVPIKVHIDFTLVAGTLRPTVRVLELKSTKRLPDRLYTSYETQLYGQLGFLFECWNQPVFNLRTTEGEFVFEGLTLPEAARKCFGVTLPDVQRDVDIEGWVLCLSMDGAKAFGPYLPSKSMLGLCQKTAENIWLGVDAVRSGRKELNDIAYCRGFHPLCDYCDYAESCPKFEAEVITEPEYDKTLEELLQLKENRLKLQEKITEKEELIRRFFDHEGVTTGVLKTPCYRITKTHYNGAVRTNLQKLTLLLKNEIGDNRAEELLSAAAVRGKPYDRLSVVRRKED